MRAHAVGDAALSVVAIIQARTDSTRLPGKALREVLGVPLIVHMVRRVQRCRSLHGLWMATSDQPTDDALARVVEREGVTVFRGPKDDVLARYERAARAAGADVVVRLTGDCPLHDPQVIDEAVTRFAQADPAVDYLSNTVERTYPKGLDVEVMSGQALERAQQEARSAYDREHVTPYINTPGKARPPFRTAQFRGPADFSHLRWTVDQPDDLELVRRVLTALMTTRPDFGWMDVLALVTREPSWIELNRRFAENPALA